MRILITGGAGMLAGALTGVFRDGNDILTLPKSEMDITDREKVLKIVSNFKPALILNPAAFTNVDACEKFPGQAFRVNAWGAGNMALAARLAGARLVHFSTDFVFDGTKGAPYREEDTPRPISTYGQSKFAGEKFIRQIHRGHYIIRTAWLFGAEGKNLLSTLHTLLQRKQIIRVSNDQWGSPTYTEDLAGAVQTLVQKAAWGTYHLSNSGCCTRFQLAQEAARHLGCSADLVQPVASAELKLPAPRPAYSVLENYRWQQLGYPPLRDCRKAYREFLKNQEKIVAELNEVES